MGIRAKLAIAQKQYSEANKYLQETLTIAKKHNQFEVICATYIAMGKIPPVESQLECLSTALQLSKKHKDKHTQSLIHLELSALYESAGDAEKSLLHFKKHHQLEKERQADHHLLQMEIAKMQYAAEKAENEANLLKVEKEFMEKEMAYNKKQLEELTSDAIQKSRVMSEIRNGIQDALTQQGLTQKKTLHSVMENAESEASSFWTLLEERYSHIGGSFTEKLLQICPDFTSIQLRIILLLKERLSSKEISQLLFVS